MTFQWISWFQRIRNLELALSVHEDRLNKVDGRLDDLEETEKGESCIGFVQDDEPMVVSISGE